jgi:sugar phosphate isomerase/epimerase
MFPGVSTQVFGDLPLEASQARMIREAGFDAVEIFAMPPHFDLRDEDGVEETARFFREEGIRIASVHSVYMDSDIPKGKGRWIDITKCEPERIDIAATHARRAIRAARVFDAPIAVVHLGTDGRGLAGESVANASSFLAMIDDELRECGVSIALENVATEISNASFAPFMIEGYGFMRVGICLDLGHANIGGDPAADIIRCGSRLIHVHAHDNIGTGDDHLVPTKGGINWKTVIESLKSIDYNGCFTFETGPGGDPKSTICECRAVYDRLMEYCK